MVDIIITMQGANGLDNNAPLDQMRFISWLSFLYGIPLYAEFFLPCGFCGMINHHYIEKKFIIKSQE